MPTYIAPAYFQDTVEIPARVFTFNPWVHSEWNNSTCSVGNTSKSGSKLFYVDKSGKGFGAAIQKAMDYCESFGGGTIYLTNTTPYYLEGTTPYKWPNRVRMLGLGSRVTRIIKDANSPENYLYRLSAFTSKGFTQGFFGVHHQGFTFEASLPPGWDANEAQGAYWLAYGRASSKSNFIDIRFYNCDSSGVGVEPVFSNQGENGLTYNYSDIHCERLYTDGASMGSGIAFGGPGPSNCNIFDSSIQARDSAIAYFCPQGLCYIFGNTINGFESHTGAAIELSLTQTLVGGYLVGMYNKITHYNGTGIFLNDYGNNRNFYNRDCEFAYNTISECNVIGNGGGGNGIYVNGGRNISIHHNNVFDCQKHGIIQTASLAKEGRNNTYFFNNIYNNSTLQPGGFANIALTVELEGKLFDNVVRNNNCYDNRAVRRTRNGLSVGVVGGYPATDYFARNIVQNNFQRLNLNSNTWFNSNVRPVSELQTANTIQI